MDHVLAGERKEKILPMLASGLSLSLASENLASHSI
jgi:hypothetical protein